MVLFVSKYHLIWIQILFSIKNKSFNGKAYKGWCTRVIKVSERIVCSKSEIGTWFHVMKFLLTLEIHRAKIHIFDVFRSTFCERWKDQTRHIRLSKSTSVGKWIERQEWNHRSIQSIFFLGVRRP